MMDFFPDLNQGLTHSWESDIPLPILHVGKVRQSQMRQFVFLCGRSA